MREKIKENWVLREKRELEKSELKEYQRKMGIPDEILIGIEIEIEEIRQEQKEILQILFCREKEEYTLCQIHESQIFIAKLPVWITSGAQYNFAEEVIKQLSQVSYKSDRGRGFVSGFYYQPDNIDKKWGFEI